MSNPTSSTDEELDDFGIGANPDVGTDLDDDDASVYAALVSALSALAGGAKRVVKEAKDAAAYGVGSTVNAAMNTALAPGATLEAIKDANRDRKGFVKAIRSEGTPDKNAARAHEVVNGRKLLKKMSKPGVTPAELETLRAQYEEAAAEREGAGRERGEDAEEAGSEQGHPGELPNRIGGMGGKEG